MVITLKRHFCHWAMQDEDRTFSINRHTEEPTLLKKTNTSKFQFDLGSEGTGLSVARLFSVTLVKQSLFFFKLRPLKWNYWKYILLSIKNFNYNLRLRSQATCNRMWSFFDCWLVYSEELRNNNEWRCNPCDRKLSAATTFGLFRKGVKMNLCFSYCV